MAINRKLLTDGIDRFRFNPVGIQGVALNFVKAVEAGEYDIVDPTNPFVHLVECAATIGASTMSEANILNRRQYALSAQTMEDLYPHMSDRDFTNLNTLPSKAMFVMGFDLEELLSRMVQVPAEEIKKVVIPRNTFVTVGETVFSLQYPIEIRQMRHEGIQIVYDVEAVSPLQTLTSNYIEPRYQYDTGGRKMLYFAVEMSQFRIESKSASLSKSLYTRVGVDITDDFYYCRVWNQLVDGNWVEIPTTYTDRIYSNNRVTAIVRVVNKTVYAEIPQYYIQTGALVAGSQIRVDVYETKGPLRLDLNGYPVGSYEMTWHALDPRELSEFAAPLAAMQVFYVMSDNITFGGTKAMTFEQLRDRTQQNGASIGNLPITPAQIQKTIQREGFTVVKNTDHVTGRTYIATQPLPDPVNSELITPASAAINTLIDSIQNLSALKTAYENNESLTLSPDTIYQVNDGILRALSNSEMAELAVMLPEMKAETVTNGHYFYTPFHYVLDTSRNQFESRPYYIDAPTIVSRSFLAENDKTLLAASIKEVQVLRTLKGYRVMVISRGSDSYAELTDDLVGATMGFQPDRTGQFAYVPGIIVGRDADEDRIWQFDIELSYDIDRQDLMEVTNAKMYDLTPISTRMPLTVSFNIFFSTSVVMPVTWEPASFESMIGDFLLPPGSVGITREAVRCELGRSLKNLWSRSSSMMGPNDYERWDIDVPDTYTEDVYRKDPVTGAAFTVVNGEVIYDKLASKGDVKLNADGTIKYKYYAGDTKLDAYGYPIVVRGRELKNRIDLMLIEAAYYYASNKAASDYRAELIRNILAWVTESLGGINKTLLEETDIFFYPTQSAGLVEVAYEDGLKKSIEAGQFFKVKLYVRDAVYKDDDLRAALRRKTIEVIGNELKARTVSVSNITDALRDAYQKDVISFDVPPFTDDLTLVTLVDDSARLSIRKRLVFREDNQFALEEDVDVQFIKHERPDIPLEGNA